jgi:hypothetical protein
VFGSEANLFSSSTVGWTFLSTRRVNPFKDRAAAFLFIQFFYNVGLICQTKISDTNSGSDSQESKITPHNVMTEFP